MGFSLLALRAGAQPKMMPTAAEKPAPRMMAKVEITKLVPMTFESTSDSVSPSSMPSAPPMTDSRNDSIRNWAWICQGMAPRAFFRPISVVRSVTVVSIMFMMPMPPTIRAMEAMPARSALTMLSMFCMVSSMLDMFMISKQSSS